VSDLSVALELAARYGHKVPFNEDGKSIDGALFHPDLSGHIFSWESRNLAEMITGLEYSTEPELAHKLIEIDRFEKDRPRVLKAAKKYNENLSTFTWVSSELLGPSAFGKFLRTRDDTSPFYNRPPMDVPMTTCLDDFLLDDCAIYKCYDKPDETKKKKKKKKKGNRHGRAHGRPPEPDPTDPLVTDQLGATATSSNVLIGSQEPETTNVESLRQPFLKPALCSSPVFESAPTKPTNHNGTSQPHPRVSRGGMSRGGGHKTPAPRA
jgi:hypothetical protein